MDNQLQNVMEMLVLQKIDEMYARGKINCCDCPICRLDIAAYALNNLPPRYVATHSGELFSRLNAMSKQYGMDLIAAITQGAELVNKKPRHAVETPPTK